MFTPRVHLKIADVLPMFLLILAALACTIPFLPAPTAESEATESVDVTSPAETAELPDTAAAPGIPAAILTEAAATIHAQVTQEAEAALPPQAPAMPTETILTATSTIPEAPQAPGPITTPTPTPTATRTRTEAAPSAPTSTASPSPTHTQPPPAMPPLVTVRPPVGGDVSYGFKIQGVNIHWCGGQPWAIFRVYNRSNKALESLSLLYQDLSAKRTLSSIAASDAPFITTDKTCISGGIESLAPGQTLYLGNSLGSSGLQGHTIQTTITLCTGNGLGGTCYQAITDFVMP